MLSALLALALVDQSPPSEAITAPAMALSACVTLAANRHAPDRVSTAEAAEAALRDCAAEDRALAAVLDPSQMAAARTRNRERAVRNVAIARGEQAPEAPTPIAAWGGCVGRNAATLSATSRDVQVVAAAALDACRAEEQVVRDSIAREQGAEAADSFIRMMRANVPSMVQQTINARSSRQ